MHYRLLLVDGHGEANTAQLGIRTLREFPGLEGLSVHFRPIRGDLLFESAKIGGQLAYRILFGEGVVRSQLWVEYEVLGEHLNVTGRSSDLLFALTLITSKWTHASAPYALIAATGVLDEDGAVLSVERTAEKVASAVRDLAPDSRAVIFYPLADAPSVDQWRARAGLPAQVTLQPVAHLEEALGHLGYALEKVYLRNPFRGLEHFEYEHHSIFFGRDSEVRDILKQLLRREHAGVPGLMVEGASGSGKSSFLRAGVLPALINLRFQSEDVQSEIGRRPISPAVRRAIWRPGLLPPGSDEEKIVLSIRECWTTFPEFASSRLAEQPQTLAALAHMRRECWPAALRFVWLIDQFEELLTVGLEDVVVDAFGEFLGQLQRDGVWTLASVRADAVPQLKRYEALRQVFGANEGQYYLATLSGPALDEVISLPAAAAGLTFGLGPEGKRLDQTLREEAYREKDSLPLLQFTLNELYLKRSGKELTYAAYEQLGGLTGSIATTANAVLKAEDADSQRIVRRLFRALVSVDELGHATRRYAPMAEIGEDLAQKQLLIRLIEARLCVTDQREGQSVVAFAHDTLLQTLPALTDWLMQEAGLLQSRELAQRESRLWQQHGQSDAWLAASDKLVAFKALEAAEIALPSQTRSFIERSTRRVRRTTRIKQAAVCLIAVLAIAASIGAWIAQKKEREAEYQTAQTSKAQMRLLTEAAAERLKDGDIAYARGVILEVLRHGGSLSQPDPAAVNVFQEIRASDPALAVLAGHVGPLHRAEYSPDGMQIVTASFDGTARVWNARTGIEVMTLSGHTGGVFSATYSPDGARIVTASGDHTARVWDAHTGTQLLVLNDAESVQCALYSPDGSRIATVSPGSVRIWDAQTGMALKEFSLPGVSFGTPHGDAGYRASAAYSPDGKRLVTTMEDQAARVWDTRTGAVVAVLLGHTGSVATAVFSPDGKRILTGGDKTARIWDAASGRQLMALSGHIGFVWSAAYSPDGTTIATASVDKTARIWDAATGRPLKVLSGHINILCAAAYSPDGSSLVTAGWDRTARTWDLRNSAQAVVVLNHDDQVGTVAFSPDGSHLLTSSADGTARVWDVMTHAQIAMLRADHDAFNSAAYSPDGAHIVTASNDKTLRIWDARTAVMLAVLTGPAEAMSAAYSPDGERVVGAFRTTIGVWDTHKANLGIERSDHRDTISNVEFSPDGSKVLSASVDKTARVWDSRTLAPLLVLPHSDFVNTAQFSSDGTRILTAENDSTARIWDARTGEQIGVLSGHHSSVYAAAISADGNRIVTGSSDRTVRIWDAHKAIQLAVFNGHDADLSAVAFSPDGAWVASASQDKTARIWSAAIGADFPTQVVWEEAAEADALPDVQRTHLGLAPTAALLADTTIKSYASDIAHPAFSAAAATPCDREAGAFYDPDRQAQGIEQDNIEPDLALPACTALTASPASARALYQAGRALIAKEDFAGARRDLELALSKGYRAAGVDLALLLTDPSARMLDPTRAVSLDEEAWRRAVSIAGFELGALFEHGIPSPSGKGFEFAPDPAKAWHWYQEAASRKEPHALARFAQRAEKDALAAASSKTQELLLEAFTLYARAAERARIEDWPDGASRIWRYRRATLARVLASDGMMQQVADAYASVVRDESRPRTRTFLERLREFEH
jgi:WD40 repeat protein